MRICEAEKAADIASVKAGHWLIPTSPNFVQMTDAEFDPWYHSPASLADELWLLVLRQLLSQLNAEPPGLRNLVQRVLIRLGINKPHAVLFGLLTAKAAEPLTSSGARAVLDVLSRHHPVEVAHYIRVSGGLSRLSVSLGNTG
jgi:hypothetical protein